MSERRDRGAVIDNLRDLDSLHSNKIKRVLKYMYCEDDVLGKGSSSIVYQGSNTETSNFSYEFRLKSGY